MEAGTLLRRARASSGLSLRVLAERAETSHATIAAYEAGRINPSVPTLSRILRAAGFGLVIELVPIPRDLDRSRGDELVEALELAAEFPARHDEELRFPKFPA